ncbi:DUF6934 family protein [Flavobacterium laiguense]|uniref:Uncharacterized protein n=1 Tax=Flavobacterium laiguense TaxID=2169409 RepID=A0A2U1JZ01_9FLAO|nr:hypothetical protein [Flavobacterium laiguense]PWA10460.1 hypothetical protein DB891_04300 [Flavobacterium laiguense]
MNHSKYLYQSEKDFLIYSFYSEGQKGRIQKMFIYSETATAGVYNLAFGDYNEANNSIDDLSISNNGDSLKTLATVASTVYAFTEKYTNAWILATGSTKVRTRLYRMGISNNLYEISIDFNIYGYINETWEKFIVGENYETFLLTKK